MCSLEQGAKEIFCVGTAKKGCKNFNISVFITLQQNESFSLKAVKNKQVRHVKNLKQVCCETNRLRET